MNSNNMLNSEQLQMIDMYKQILCDTNIRKYIEGMGRSGYLTGISYTEEGTAEFNDLDQSRYTGYSINELFQGNFLWMVKRMLADWHNKKVYVYQPKDDRGCINYLMEPISVSVDLTRKQRGILTKILKIENKRKKLLNVETN